MTVQVALPTILLVLAYVLRLVVDRRPTAGDLVLSVLELQADFAFLVTSLLATFLIVIAPARLAGGLILLFGYIVGWIVVIVLAKRSADALARTKHAKATGLAVLGYLLCIVGFGFALTWAP